jgi:hypothetical protein
MESMPALEHPSEAKLAAVLNVAMPPDEVERILEHLDDCKRCEERLEELEPAIAEYRRFRARIAPQLPRPSRPWPDIQMDMERLDRQPSKLRRISAPPQPVRVRRSRVTRPAQLMRAGWMSAIAAGVLICGLLLWPRGDGLLRAETLLLKASNAASHSTVRARSHLRVKTRTASFIRPAVLSNGVGADGLDAMKSRFQAAHYDWTDPLNPAAFTDWRNGLRSKVDKVARQGTGDAKEYTIDTSTPEGGLRDAALTIEAKDMLPVSGRFEFSDSEWVEIATIPEAVEAPVAAAPSVSLPAPVTAPPVVTRPALSEIELAERELEVRAAIDGLQASIGEPIGIEVESGSVVVTIYNLAPQQEGQLRASLGGMEGVIIRSPDRGADSGPDAPPTSQAAQAAPFPAIDTSEAIVSRAHVLSQLAVRFPPEMEPRLSATGRGLLADMRARHAAAINRDIDTLSSQLSGTRPLSIPKEAPARDPAGSSPASMAALTDAAASVHRLVTSVYAAGAGNVDAASAWPELASELSRLRRLARQLREVPETMR